MAGSPACVLGRQLPSPRRQVSGAFACGVNCLPQRPTRWSSSLSCPSEGVAFRKGPKAVIRPLRGSPRVRAAMSAPITGYAHTGTAFTQISLRPTLALCRSHARVRATCPSRPGPHSAKFRARYPPIGPLVERMMSPLVEVFEQQRSIPSRRA